MISAIVLAAGQSKRMGKAKQVLAFGDSTILEETIGNLLKSRIDEIILVLGHQADSIAPRLEDKPIKIVFNPEYRQGMSSSIKRGIDHASSTTDAFMISLGDQPMITSETVNQLIMEFDRSKYGIVLPVYKGSRGHPVIFAARYKPELSVLQGDTGARAVIEAHPDDIHEVEVNSASVITDINTEEDYLAQH